MNAKTNVFRIRFATVEDAAEIATVHVDTWKEAYKTIIPQDYLDNLSYKKRTELWKSNLSDTNNYIIVVETVEKEIVGFAVVHEIKNDSMKPAGKLSSIYILDRFHGQGLGRKLLFEIFDYCRKNGFEYILVDVLSENDARFFYEKFGAKLVDEMQIEIAGVPLKEAVYRWDNIEQRHTLI